MKIIVTNNIELYFDDHLYDEHQALEVIDRVTENIIEAINEVLAENFKTMHPQIRQTKDSTITVIEPKEKV